MLFEFNDTYNLVFITWQLFHSTLQNSILLFKRIRFLSFFACLLFFLKLSYAGFERDILSTDDSFGGPTEMT